MRARILIIEDEYPMRRVLEGILKSEDYRVMTATNGAEGLESARQEKPDLILMDVMMPKLDGFSLAAELRRIGFRCPILMLTAKGGVEDRVAGLDAGADDYLVKPFSTQELLARVRAALRRIEKSGASLDVLELGEWRVDFVRQSAKQGRRDVHLTSKEFAILRMLAEARGGVVSREQFLDVIWGYGSFPTTRTVDTHVATLRNKIEQNPADPRWIQTVHGAGYRLMQ